MIGRPVTLALLIGLVVSPAVAFGATYYVRVSGDDAADGLTPSTAWRSVRKAGAEIAFDIAGTHRAVTVFTTRADTLYGATFLALAPEHPLVDIVTTDGRREAVAAYRDAAARKSDLQRQELEREKTGVFTGGYAVNPVNGLTSDGKPFGPYTASSGVGATVAVSVGGGLVGVGGASVRVGSGVGIAASVGGAAGAGVRLRPRLHALVSSKRNTRIRVRRLVMNLAPWRFLADLSGRTGASKASPCRTSL